MPPAERLLDLAGVLVVGKFGHVVARGAVNGPLVALGLLQLRELLGLGLCGGPVGTAVAPAQPPRPPHAGSLARLSRTASCCSRTSARLSAASAAARQSSARRCSARIASTCILATIHHRLASRGESPPPNSHACHTEAPVLACRCATRSEVRAAG